MKDIILNPNVKKRIEKKHFEIWLLMSHFVLHYCEPGPLQVCHGSGIELFWLCCMCFCIEFPSFLSYFSWEVCQEFEPNGPLFFFSHGQSLPFTLSELLSALSSQLCENVSSVCKLQSMDYSVQGESALCFRIKLIRDNLVILYSANGKGKELDRLAPLALQTMWFVIGQG